MVQPVCINPEAVYDDGAVMMALDIPSASLARGRRDGHLRYTKKGRRVLYLGRWLLDWIEKDSTPTRLAEVVNAV